MKLDVMMGVDEMLDKFDDIKDHDLVVMGLDPRRARVEEFASVMNDIGKRLDGIRKKPRLAFFIFSRDQPWKDAEARIWANDFIEGHLDCLRHVLDEVHMRREGFDMDTFPGVGRIRFIALAGYGRITEMKCGGVIIELDELGQAYLKAVRGESVGLS